MRRALLVAVLAVSVLLGACGSDDDGGDAGGRAITVGAASSLKEAFTELGDAFETANPGTAVTFNFAASSEVVQGINEGAPTDVFASADAKNMDKLVAGAGVAADPQVFATNQLQIIVGKGNPEGITGVADLANPDLLVVTCAPEVPIGAYTQQVFDAAGVTVQPVSLEENVKGIVSKVTLGEADAGVVYRTDVIAAADTAEGVDIPADINVTATYPIAVTKDAADTAVADAFVAFVLSADGRSILQTYGFGAP